MIKGLTEVADKVLPETPKSAFYVFFREYPPEAVGVGGMPLPEYIKSLEQK
jgi:phenylpyruvate tautomerase PptA (4-oxalocrotonate tautomerase family)